MVSVSTTMNRATGPVNNLHYVRSCLRDPCKSVPATAFSTKACKRGSNSFLSDRYSAVYPD
eukprot:616186-Pyramimonas_sp.AAC.1